MRGDDDDEDEARSREGSRSRAMTSHRCQRATTSMRATKANGGIKNTFDHLVDSFGAST